MKKINRENLSFVKCLLNGAWRKGFVFQHTYYNQSRICGKVVGLGLFPSDSLQSQLYEFIEIAHIEHTMV